jgi:outer membrane lipoprotein-sorting protein
MKIVLLTAAAFLLAPLGAVRAADDAMAIVDKAIKAHGGAEDLAKFKAAQWKAKGALQLPGFKVSYTGKYSFQAPNQFRIDMDSEFGGQKIAIGVGTDGMTAWEKSGDQSQEQNMKKAQAFKDSVYGINLARVLPLKDKDITLATAGEEKVGGKPALGVLAKSKGQPDVTLYFDKDTGLLVKTKMQIWDEFSNKDVTQETLLQDYKLKDGKQMFNKLVIRRGDKDLIEEELSDYKPLEKLEASVFAKP